MTSSFQHPREIKTTKTTLFCGRFDWLRILLSDCGSKIWLLLLRAVITWPVNLSLSGRGEEGGKNWFSCCTSSLASLFLVRSQRPWKLSSLCVHLRKETTLVAPPSDVILITLHPYLVCHGSPSSSSFLTLCPHLRSSCFYPPQIRLVLFLLPSIHSLPPSSPSPSLVSDSDYPAADLHC